MGIWHMRIVLPTSDVDSYRGAAGQAAERKRSKYSSLPNTHEFVPVAMESLGLINDKGLQFLQELGRCITEAMGDPRESIHL